MPSMKSTSQALAVFSLTISAVSSQAALTAYTSSASFAAATTAASTDTFNDLVIDTLPSPTTRTLGTYGYTVTGGSQLFGVGTPADTWLSTRTSGVPLVFDTFVGGVRAIGGLFFGSNQDFTFLPGQSLTVTAVDSLGDSASREITNATTSSFVGFTSTGSISSLTVSIADTEAYGTANDLVLAQLPTAPVPEPATLGMLLAGLGALGIARRRRGT